MMNLIHIDFILYVVMVKRNQEQNLFMEIENLNYQMKFMLHCNLEIKLISFCIYQVVHKSM